VSRLNPLFALCVALAATHCVPAGSSSAPPAFAPPTPQREPLTADKKFRIATIDFGNDGNGNDPLTVALPAILLTELEKEDRFSIHEGGNLRRRLECSLAPPAKDGGRPISDCVSREIIREDNASEFADAYLGGTITSKRVASDGSGEVCFDVRLSNAINHEVLFAGSACTALAATAAGGVSPAREGLQRLAAEISRAVKEIGFAKVLSADGKLVTVDKGASAGVIRGMVAYVVATGDTISDPAFHAAVQQYTGVNPAADAWASTPAIVAEVYVVAVEPNHSIALLYKGDYAVPGDTVFFK